MSDTLIGQNHITVTRDSMFTGQNEATSMFSKSYAVADLRKQVLDAPSPFAHFSSFSCSFQENLAEY